MKSSPRQADVKAVSYHRNGVSGESFYTVRFTSPQIQAEHGKGVFDGEFLATVPADALTDDHKWKKGRAGECFVIYLANPEEHWRGDHFSTVIQEAIRTHSKGA